MTAVLNLDGSKLFIIASALYPEVTEEDKVRVFDTNTNQVTDSIQLNGGAVGVLSSPDYQSLYIATPAGPDYMDISISNIDVLNMSDYSIEQITTPEPPIVITSSPATTTDIADMTVGVVLGVADGASGTATGDGASNILAETGIMQVSSILLVGVILSVLLYTYVDFRKHRKPLLEMDSSARYTYTYAHHIKTVTIPLMRYRISVSVRKT
jgi:hypothetical protein